ncbi:hypothetical protein [Nesterenkonia pannonica]|uniref:hypothetical protein n=1 Tax=Nesterenkonia pannonica TaxID=1548602 RepID=UPI002164A38D|nr:hypothetical protein [Nesterenkonia pannonica]
MRFGGPRNNFRLGPASSYRFIAGGIGITPLLPMIRQAAELEADWRLLYLGRRSSALAYLPELAPHGDRVQVHCSHDAGRQDIAAWLGEMPDDCLVYACGPNPLLDDAEALRDRFSGPRIRTERFTGRAQSQSIDSSPTTSPWRRAAG